MPDDTIDENAIDQLEDPSADTAEIDDLQAQVDALEATESPYFEDHLIAAGEIVESMIFRKPMSAETKKKISEALKKAGG